MEILTQKRHPERESGEIHLGDQGAGIKIAKLSGSWGMHTDESIDNATNERKRLGGDAICLRAILSQVPDEEDRNKWADACESLRNGSLIGETALLLQLKNGVDTTNIGALLKRLEKKRNLCTYQ